MKYSISLHTKVNFDRQLCSGEFARTVEKGLCLLMSDVLMSEKQWIDNGVDAKQWRCVGLQFKFLHYGADHRANDDCLQNS